MSELIEGCRVHVIDADAGRVRAMRRVLKTMVDEVTFGDPTDSLPDDGAVDIVIVGYDGLPDPAREAIAARYGDDQGETRLLLTCTRGWQDRYREIFHDLRLRNLLARDDEHVDPDDLIVTLRKLMSREVFGLSKYFIWGVEGIQLKTGRSADKDEIVEAVGAYADRVGVHARLRAQACVVADELLTNALYNAPTGDDGARLFADLRRDTDVVLPGGAEVEVDVRSDGKRLGVAVRDPYGSLTAGDVTRYLAKCFGGGEIVEDKAGGAGIGLFQVFDAVSHFVVNIAPGQRAEAIGLIRVEGGYKNFAMRGKSFNIFVGDAT